jgi:peroxiredoxin
MGKKIQRVICNYGGYKSAFYVRVVETILSIYQEENGQLAGTTFTPENYHDLANRLPIKLRSPVLFFRLSKDIALGKGTVDDSLFVNAANLLSDKHLQQLVVDKVKSSRLLRVGEKAPDFSVRNLAGQPVTLSSLKGKVVYLDFWFAGCGPCHQLFKAIEPVKKHFEADSRVIFLTVSIDDETSWKQALSRFKIAGYHVFTENKFQKHPIIQSYQVSYYPTTYLLTPQGDIHSVSPPSDANELKQQISVLLAQHKN